MKSTSVIRAALAASSAIGLLATLPAFAAAEAPAAEQARHEAPTDTDTQDIIVTARRIEERLQDVPISITVFNQSQLNNRNIVNATDLATYTPSLSSNNRFGAENSSFAIRGFVQEGQTSASVAVYFAEAVAPRAQAGTGGGNGAGVGSFFDLQNVQILKGPQGTLFGRNTTGGAVLLVPQKPTGKVEGYVEGSLGTYNLHRIQAVFNAPISENLRVRLGVDHQDRDGYLKNVSGIGPKDFNDIGYTAARLSLVADLTPNLENYFIGTYSLSDTNGTLPKMKTLENTNRDPFPQLRVEQIKATSGSYYDVSNGLPEAHQKIEQWQLINNTTWNVSDALTLKNILSYAQFRLYQASQIYGDNPYQNTAISPDPYAPINLVPAHDSHNAAQMTFTEEFRAQVTALDDRLTGQAGVYFEKSNPLGGFQSTYSANTLACTDLANFQCRNARRPLAGGGFTTISGFIQNSRSQYRFTSYGLYAQATFKFTNTLSLTGGIRYTSDEVKGVGEVLKITFPTPNTPSYACSQPNGVVTGGTSAQILADPSRCDLRRTVKSKKPTWLVDLDYKPTDDLLFYAKYARGYRQGGANVSSYGLETWLPEQVDLYEIGAKTSFNAPFPITLDVSGFYNDFTNQQIAINTVSCANVAPIPNYQVLYPACAGVPASAFPSPAQGIGNGAKSTIKGVEAEVMLRPFTGFSLNVAYAYLDTKLGEKGLYPDVAYGFAFYSPNGVVNGPLSLSPKNKYSITGTYVLPLAPEIGRVSVGATFTHQDSQYGNASSVSLFVLPPQDNLNLNLNWYAVAGSSVDLSVFATNVTGIKNYNFATGASFGWDSVGITEPRMVGARVKYRFGG